MTCVDLVHIQTYLLDFTFHSTLSLSLISEKLNSIMESCGLKTLQCNYVHRSTINKKEGLDVPRIFVQGKFSKCVEQDLDRTTCSSFRRDSCNHKESNSSHELEVECVLSQPEAHSDLNVNSVENKV